MTTVEERIRMKLRLWNSGDLVSQEANRSGKDPTSGIAFAMYLAVQNGRVSFADIEGDFGDLVAIRPDLAKYREWARALKVG